MFLVKCLKKCSQHTEYSKINTWHVPSIFTHLYKHIYIYIKKLMVVCILMLTKGISLMERINLRNNWLLIFLGNIIFNVFPSLPLNFQIFIIKSCLSHWSEKKWWIFNFPNKKLLTKDLNIWLTFYFSLRELDTT